MAYLELRDLRKNYGGAQVVRGVDLSIEQGEFIVFVGPSGCGKSTLLRLIAGLETISSGQLLLDGRDITHAASGKRDLAMVFQSYALYPHMSVYDNMSFALRLAGVPREEIRRKVGQAAESLHLTPYLERRPRDLSGGQRQRVAIGRAIVRAPKVFLFDEPLSNLDAALRGNTRVEIHKLHKALGATTIYVTHDQVEAMTLADRVVVLRDGGIEQVGAPLALYDRPANQFVARFIGMPSMNLIDSDNLPAFCESMQVRLPLDGATLGIRPEALRVTRAQDGGAAIRQVLGRVELIEALGADTLIHVNAGGAQLIARQAERTPMAVGDAVSLALEPGCTVHLFDRQGRALASP
ncbi:Maltose/maltodextrin import ATP-binding protein MalK [Delftia tsuruhatensis]|uniref:ABC transporter ATP-binding protein n=1 Tax=Delftia tsuruhatensis TaxID=180282 RepID=UPI001E80B394|nr:sn-glycerol-3-phosphate ABC transporter ATP-binding protein UgpC [Delftia tsuruhatensis]CAB5664685.1 Maltose/maltodextrin import ATP-binding protein MalK [Delftia tsuruhatensis]CAC9677450.1 Maltose/maltodextrin import ATP-binding protein MalK [Delftia tsuruhatensis]